MSFDIHGTFTVSQFERFKTYVRNQLELIDARIAHLQAERDRIGNLQFAYDSGGEPTGVANDPPQTYCGKLYGAYVALGGDPEFDLQFRSTGQPVYRLSGDETQAAQQMSNGEVLSVLGRADAESSGIMTRMRGWVRDDLQRRRDLLERKIRRALDYAEQLEAEISELQLIRSSADTEDSLEFLIREMEALASNRQYFAITEDNGNDPHGKFARAPVAAYMPGGGGKGAKTTSFQRTLDGLAKPTE